MKKHVRIKENGFPFTSKRWKIKYLILVFLSKSRPTKQRKMSREYFPRNQTPSKSKMIVKGFASCSSVENLAMN